MRSDYNNIIDVLRPVLPSHHGHLVSVTVDGFESDSNLRVLLSLLTGI